MSEVSRDDVGLLEDPSSRTWKSGESSSDWSTEEVWSLVTTNRLPTIPERAVGAASSRLHLRVKDSVTSCLTEDGVAVKLMLEHEHVDVR